MKALRLFVALAIFTGFAVNTAQSQAVVLKDRVWTLWTDDNGWPGYQSTDAQEVYCPDGTINVVITFQLDVNDSWVPKKGVNQLWIYGPYGGCWIYIHPNGKAKVYMHYPAY